MYKDLTEKFREFFETYRDKKIIFCGHRHADIDAIGSAFALSTTFPNSTVAYVDEMDGPAKHMVERFNINAIEVSKLNLDEYDGVVAVDTSSRILLPVDESKIIGIFDHHMENENTIHSAFEFKDEDARATAEIVANLLNFSFDEETAAILASAIMSDTYRFITASQMTLKTFNKLLEKSNMEYEELLRIAFPKRHYDEVNAILTAFNRCRWIEHKGNVIVSSIVSTAGSSAAAKLAEVGDISIVASWDEKINATKVSLRGGLFCNIRLDKVAFDIGKYFGGGGGGHPKASGALCKNGKPEEVILYGVELIKRYIDEVSN